MNGSDIIIMFGMSFVFFLGGMVASFFIGGKTALNYLLVKMSRGKKVLIFAKNAYGWKSYTGKKEEQKIIWTYDKTKITSTILENTVYRYNVVDCVFIDTDTPTSTLKTEKGLFPADFDIEVFNNLLIRALTKPNADGTDDLKKLLGIIIVGVVLVLLACVNIYFKVASITGTSGGVI